MDVKERRPYCSLTKGRRDRERRYTSSSGEGEECRVPTQKSYSSSETLKAFDHDSSRLLYGSRVKDTVHREADEYARPAGQNFNLRQLGICEPAARRGLAFCAEMGLPHRDAESEGVMSPEHAVRLWGRGVKSGRSSCLSSRSNSALTLTDTEHDNKSDSENGSPMPSSLSSPSPVTEHAHSQPPSPNLHDNRRPLLSNDPAQPVHDSDSDEEYTARLYLPVNQAGQAPACNDRLEVVALASTREREIECREVSQISRSGLDIFSPWKNKPERNISQALGTRRNATPVQEAPSSITSDAFRRPCEEAGDDRAFRTRP